MHYGTITVTLTTVSGQFFDVHGTANASSQHSREIDAQALPVLREEALAAKSANIANVSGATFTCNAYKQALSAAMSQAGL